MIPSRVTQFAGLLASTFLKVWLSLFRGKSNVERQNGKRSLKKFFVVAIFSNKINIL